MMDLSTLEASHPMVRWREPARVFVEGSGQADPYLICRVCIAAQGLAASEVPDRAFPDEQAFEQHLREAHQ